MLPWTVPWWRHSKVAGQAGYEADESINTTPQSNILFTTSGLVALPSLRNFGFKPHHSKFLFIMSRPPIKDWSWAGGLKK